METLSNLYETNLYRCLVYQEKQTDDIYLTLCGVEKCLPGYEFRCGSRGGYHLHVILSGRGVLNVNGMQSSLRRGQMFVTKPGENTWYRADAEDPWTYCWMTFDGLRSGYYAGSAGFLPGVNSLQCRIDQSRFYACVKDVLDRPAMTLANDIWRLSMLLQFISLAVESNENKQFQNHREAVFSPEVYADKALTFIQANFANIRITDVAQNIGINRSYLTKVFKKKMGISPQEYLMQCRFDHACSLLAETDAMIQDIARRVGYDNVLTFSKIFKERYGVSPKNYRIIKRNEKEPFS